MVVIGGCGDYSLEDSIFVEGLGDGLVCVPYDLLNKFLGSIGDCDLGISVSDGYSMGIVYTGGSVSFVCSAGLLYPVIGSVVDFEKAEFSIADFSMGLKKLLLSIGNDDLRPVLSGLYVNNSGGVCDMVSTDAHVMGIYSLDYVMGSNFSFIIPSKVVSLLVGLLEGDSLLVSYNEKNADFSFSGKVLRFRFIDGKYPNYRAVIPDSNDKDYIFDKSNFQSALKRVGIFANKQSNLVRLSFSDKGLMVIGEDIDYVTRGEELLSCDYHGDYDIGFSSKYFNLLKAIDSSDFRLSLGDINKAGLIYDCDSDRYTGLLMPLMLN